MKMFAFFFSVLFKRLLKEKYDAATQSKNFYKEQWAKAFRECHKINRVNICDRKDNLFTVKCDRYVRLVSSLINLLFKNSIPLQTL